MGLRGWPEGEGSRCDPNGTARTEESVGRRSDTLMVLDAMRAMITRRPAWIMASWLAVAGLIGCFAPNLTKLAALAQASMLSSDAESRRAAALVNQCWPDQAYDAMSVAVLHRPTGLTEADLAYARRLSQRFEGAGRPAEIAGVLGPASGPEVAERLKSKDNTVSLVAVMLTSSFVAPASHDAVAWMQQQAKETRPGTTAGARDALDG